MKSLLSAVVAVVVVLALSGAATAQQPCPNCGRVHQVQQRQTGGDVVRAWGNAALIQHAITASRYRAQRRIHGHARYDLSMQGWRRAGVAWSSHGTMPRTCYWGSARDPRAAYAVVRGRDGYYATLLIR